MVFEHCFERTWIEFAVELGEPEKEEIDLERRNLNGGGGWLSVLEEGGFVDRLGAEVVASVEQHAQVGGEMEDEVLEGEELGKGDLARMRGIKATQFGEMSTKRIWEAGPSYPLTDANKVGDLDASASLSIVEEKLLTSLLPAQALQHLCEGWIGELGGTVGAKEGHQPLGAEVEGHFRVVDMLDHLHELGEVDLVVAVSVK